MDRLMRKFDTARDAVPAPVVDEVASYGIISFGTTMSLLMKPVIAWRRGC